MFSIEEFKYYLGETILCYQLIEHDLKIIYAGMLKGNFNDNIAITNEEYHGLGQIVKALQELENNNNKAFFSYADYKLLKSLARERNYFCHQCIIDFGYIQNFLTSNEYKLACNKLKKANSEILSLQKQTEKIRLFILKKLNRI